MKKLQIQRRITKKATQSLQATKSLFSNHNLFESTKTLTTLFNEIPPELILNKTLKASNLLINLFEGTLKEFDIYIIDFKCFRINKDNLNKILTDVKKTPINIPDKFLSKIGYHYDNDREMLSVFYYRGKAVPFTFTEINNRKQSESISEERVKLCLIQDFLSMYKDPQQVMANSLFHPSLLFFLEKEGLIFADNLFSIIFTHFRECLSPLYYPYFGHFEGIENENNAQAYIIICIIVYFFSNDFSNESSSASEGNVAGHRRHITYDEIIHRMKVDLMRNEKDLGSVFKNMTKDKYTKLKAMITNINMSLEGALSSLFKSYKLFYEELIQPANCDSCNITSQQIEASMFTIHYPCYNILCNKCLPSHDCKLPILIEIDDKEQKLLQEKAISILLSNKEKMPYSKEYEKIASNLYGDFYTSLFKKIQKETLNEKVVDYIYMLIINEQKDLFKQMRKEYKDLSENGNLQYDSDEEEKLNQLLQKMEDKIQLITQFNQIFLSYGSNQFNQMSIIKTQFNEICLMLKKDIFMQLDQLLTILLSRCKAFLARYSFETLIDEFDMKSYYTRLSIYIRKSNIVLCYDFNINDKAEFHCPYTIPLNSSTINLKSMFMITGGHRSKSTYALMYNDNIANSNFCQLADMTTFHMYHSMIKVGFFYIYCISGSTTNKNEYYNLFTNEWKPLAADLPKSYANSSLFLYNQIDLYIFFGECKENTVLRPSFDILRLELFVDNQQWEKVNFIPPEDFAPMSRSGIVHLNESNILLVGGSRLNKNNEAMLSSDIYLFNINAASIKKEEQKLGDAKGISFSDGNFYEISDEMVATWGDNQKMIKMNRYIDN